MNKNHSRYSHGMSGTRPYGIWKGMLNRCRNPKVKNYSRYGGKGIKVCDRWLKFEAFWEDMKDGYKDNLEIDRIKSDGNYEPNNCRWVTETVQGRNKNSVRKYPFKGKLMVITEIAEIIGLPTGTIRDRLKNGWSQKRAFTTPKKEAGHHVSYDKERAKWKAYLNKNGVRYELGRYKTKEEALLAVKTSKPMQT